MNLSELVEVIRQSIGDAMEEDDDINPELMLSVNGIITPVDAAQVNQHEIILSPRGS